MPTERRNESRRVHRNEIKHEISAADKAAICASMRVVARPDQQAPRPGRPLPDSSSLYFDTPAEQGAAREARRREQRREKLRIRFYNGDPSVMHLEKKIKRGGLGCKVSAPITAEEAQRIVDGDTDWMAVGGRRLIVELYAKMKSEGLRPETIVDYTRTPFVYGPGNVTA